MWDEEDNSSIPPWFSGQEYVLFGTKAVTVQAASYADVQLIVCDEAHQPKDRQNYTTLASGPIAVGEKGVAVGSGISGHETVAISTGLWHVEVWVDTPRTAKKIIFVFRLLTPRYLGDYDFALFCDLALTTSDPSQSLQGLIAYFQKKQYEHHVIVGDLIRYAKKLRAAGNVPYYVIVHALIEELIGWDKVQG